ncbi:methyl-accepting chemotaxis protein [Orenia marismortui]|uniref:methyl-accepting chemotaxis protein n=1 Tax=Orenia marismortui TaxID=46469 RepID=UPI00037726FB|nr:methyl-accepting chemotaxis protein [Orenia marismortui]
MTASIQEVAANSEDTDVLSKNTVDFVEEGSKVIKKTIDSMEDISKRSEEISDIIALVNEIAAQTNLLSLNAAIEAARAGEHGKGFAVVAEQVRDLALRTANSSKKIENLIHNIINKIDEGSSLIVEADNSLENIIKNSQKTSRGIEEIAVAMDEQSSAAEQIQIAIEELNSLTQDNVIMVEEVNQTSDYLEEESNGLFEIIEKFELK